MAILLIGQCWADEWPSTHQFERTTLDGGKWEIVQSPLVVRNTILLDKSTGETFLNVRDDEGNGFWQTIPMQKAATRPAYEKPVYQIFLSGMAAKYAFLLNSKTGKTWQLVMASGSGIPDFLYWEDVPVNHQPSDIRGWLPKPKSNFDPDQYLKEKGRK